MMRALLAKGNRRTRHILKELRKQAQADKAPRVALRIQGIMLSLDRYTSGEIAQLLKVHRATVHSWIRLWNDHGKDGLMEGHRSGRPSRLSPKEQQRLADIVESGPIAYGLNSGVWTSPIIQQVIQEEFLISYHPGHVRKMLKKFGFSVQRPTTKLVQADLRKQRKWTRYTYPNLKKTLAKRRQ